MVEIGVYVSADQASGRPVALHVAYAKDHDNAFARAAIGASKHFQPKTACRSAHVGMRLSVMTRTCVGVGMYVSREYIDDSLTVAHIGICMHSRKTRMHYTCIHTHNIAHLFSAADGLKALRNCHQGDDPAHTGKYWM